MTSTSAADGTIDLLAEMRATPAAERAARLAKLARPMLVHLAAITFHEWERQDELCRRELEEMRSRLSRLEAHLPERAP